jgi:uncharacterized repeat protein (TIGR03803 family)
MWKQATVHAMPLAGARSLLRTCGALMVALTLSTPWCGAQTIYSFTGGTDGANPFGGLTAGRNGVLYGTTQSGTVFQLTPPTSLGGTWTESVISTVGYSPLASPTVGPNGELYGTTYFGGAAGVGDIYELMPPSSPGGAWTETTLYAFSYAVGTPQNPQAGVVIGRNGVLYGTVQFAGTSPNCLFRSVSYGCGAVYSLTPPASSGGTWTYQTLYIFQGGNDGAIPLAGLAIGRNGELYGTTYAGGPGSACTGHNFHYPGFVPQSTGCGTVFELDPPASPGDDWTETVLYSFTAGSDGGFPNAVVYQDGALDGTVTVGGNPTNCAGVGCGGVFRLSPPAAPGDSWTEKVIYNFMNVPDGLFPGAGVVIGNDGTLYGTTLDGGDKDACIQFPGCGVVFQLRPPEYPDQDWREKVLHRFTATDGWRPTAGVVIGEDWNLYGTTYYGGSTTNCAYGCGVVFRVSTQH